MLRHAGFVVLLIALSLGVRMIGEHRFERTSWTDADVNAAMILSGTGPVGELKTSAGKFFAGRHALFSGIMFIAVSGLLLGPVAHRVTHKFHFVADHEKSGS